MSLYDLAMERLRIPYGTILEATPDIKKIYKPTEGSLWEAGSSKFVLIRFKPANYGDNSSGTWMAWSVGQKKVLSMIQKDWIVAAPNKEPMKRLWIFAEKSPAVPAKPKSGQIWFDTSVPYVLSEPTNIGEKIYWKCYKLKNPATWGFTTNCLSSCSYYEYNGTMASHILLADP